MTKDGGATEMNNEGAEIHLQFEIKKAASAVSNPVCLHGFDPIPLWEVGQGVQERLQEGGRQKGRHTFAMR